MARTRAGRRIHGVTRAADVAIIGAGFAGLSAARTLRRAGASGPALRERCGRIHWAGTETAAWLAGYIDGAIASGERAAAEILSPRGAAKSG